MTIIATILVGFALFLLMGFYRNRVKERKYGLQTWAQLCERILPVEQAGIRTLAEEYLDPSTHTAARSPEEIWSLVGGVKGLASMKENSDILLAMASRALLKPSSENKIVFEQMQRDSLSFQRAIIGLSIGKTSGYGKGRVSVYIHEAASAYYLMRKRLFKLFENGGLTHEVPNTI